VERDALDAGNVPQHVGDLLLERVAQRTAGDGQRDRDADVAALDLDTADHVELGDRALQLRVDDPLERTEDLVATGLAHAFETSRSNLAAAAPRGRASSSTGPNRSPRRSIRSSATSMPKSRGRTSGVSSSQWSGVETGAPGFGRTLYTDAIVLPQPFWRWSTRTPSRFFFSHSVVIFPGCRCSGRREACSANAYVCSNEARRAIGARTWMPSAPLVFTYPGNPTSSSSSRMRCATSIASSNPSSGGSRSKRTKSGRCGLSTREYHAFMSMQLFCTMNSTASVEFTSAKSTSRAPPSRGCVVYRRVEIQLGRCFGACFWKKTSPSMPCG